MRLTAEEVGFSYGDRAILTAVSLTVEIGEAVAVVGPSGSGKTTLLALLGGLLRPSSGRICVTTPSGAELDCAKQVSWVLQTSNVLPRRSVLDNVVLGSYTTGIARRAAETAARQALEQVGLADLSAARTATLSGGETQRVVIARSLVSELPFVLADEPTGQLDADTTHSVITSLLKTRSNRGLLVVTHDATVAERCDRQLRLDAGGLVVT